MDPRTQLSSEDGDLLPDSSQYHRLIGRLLYLTLSRPDITFVVHKLGLFVAQPRVSHLKAVHHLLRYIKANQDRGYTFLQLLPSSYAPFLM